VLIGGLSLAVVAATTVICYLPLWEGRGTFAYLTIVGQMTNYTLPSLLRDLTAGHLQLSLSNTIVQFSMAAILGCYMLWHARGVRDMNGLLSAAAGLAFLTPLALFWFQPWYLTLAMGLVALRPWWFMYRSALIFSLSVMFFDSFWWHTPLSTDIQKPLRAFVVFGPPIVILLILKAREVLPRGWDRMMSWSLKDAVSSNSARSMKAPSLGWLGIEVTALFAAAAVPMILVVSSSPQLKALATLLALKLKLVTNL
jgi:hypothetical protein